MLFATLVILILVTNVFSAATNYKEIPDDDSDPYKPMPPAHIEQKETEIKFWREKGQQALHEKLSKKLNTNVAKNVIFLMGDGMSIPTITASRIYQGQLNKQNGEETRLFFETFPFSGLSKTYCVDKQVPDSASTSTAYLRGVKANYMTIGVSAKVKPADCESAKIESNRPTSILKWAQDAGKATGIVTNTRVTDASPAGAYAHVPLRDMECDADVVDLGLDTESCDYDIAKQMIHEKVGQNMKVIMGGGWKKFLPKEGSSTHGNGSRLDKDLIEDWKNNKRSRNATCAYINTAAELDKIDIQNTDYLLGLFAPSNMNYMLERPADQPTLSQMTEAAIKILQKEPNGFFLFVEGGLIDKAHHYDRARKALAETIEFSKAVEVAAKLTSEEDTLIVVTADHSHTMSINGYPARGHDILGIYGKSKNGMPYSTLSYANGLGYRPESTPGVGFDMENDDLHDINYKYPALVLKDYESHGGDDVAVFARGPWAHIFSGTFEQSFIPIAEAHAANISIPDETSMQPETTLPPPTTSPNPTDPSTTVASSPPPADEHKSSAIRHTLNYMSTLLFIVIFSINVLGI